jgi:hypothetical protein
MCGIIQKIKQRHLTNTGRRKHLTEGMLNLLVAEYNVAAQVMGVLPLPYAGIPESWLRRDERGMVTRVIIGGE